LGLNISVIEEVDSRYPLSRAQASRE